MGERTLQTLLEGGSFFESPRWHEGRWWVSDFYNERVLAVDTDGRAEEVMTVPGRPSGLGWMPDGSMLVVSMRDHKILRRSPDGAVTSTPTSASTAAGTSTTWSSTRRGRAYVGNFGFDLMSGG